MTSFHYKCSFLKDGLWVGGEDIKLSCCVAFYPRCNVCNKKEKFKKSRSTRAADDTS